MGFIHAHDHQPAPETPAYRLQHLPNQPIGFLFPHKQAGGAVLYRIIFREPEHLFHMPQDLYGRDDADAVQVRLIVKLP